MAAIDLKNATIRIRDGYALADPLGAVNLMAGYAIGLSSIAVDAFTGAILVNSYVKFASHDTHYLVTAVTLSLGATTNITISPALTAAVADNEVVTVLSNELEITIGEGNLTFTEKKPRTYILDRGRLDTVKDGDEAPVEVKLDFTWEFLKASSGDPPTVEDALKQRGGASSWVSSSADPCEPYAVDIEIEYIPPCGGEDTETITLNDFRYEELAHDPKTSQISATGKCNITEASVARS